MLEVNNLSHKYEANYALNSVTLKLSEPNGVVGLLGSNGAGKSTLMNIICGCLSQTSGQVKVGGYDVLKEPLAVRARIGFLPQQAPLSMELTIREYITFCAQLRGLDRKSVRKHVDGTIERCGLQSMRNRLIANLSGGYRQRVGIAQAIVHHPELVVLDEPTVGLDPNQILGVRRLVKEIAEERTVVFSTHILSEVDVLCNNVIMIEGGQVVFDHSIDEFRAIASANSVILVCDYPPDQAEIFAAHESIIDVETISNGRFRLKTDGDRTVSAALLALGQHWGIQEVFFEQASLDDVFRILSAGGKS